MIDFCHATNSNMSIRVTVGVNRTGRKNAFIEHLFTLVRMPSFFRADRRFWCGVLLAFLVVGLSSCGPSSRKEKGTSETRSAEKEARDPNSTRYELKVHWIDINASYVITINGFPALQEYVQARSVDNKFDVQLNTGLVGRGNHVQIRLEPLVTRAGKNLSIGTIEIEAQVLGPGRSPISGARITTAQVDSVYKAWSERAREQWEKYLKWEEKWLQEHPDSSSTITARDGGSLDSMRQWTARNPMVVSTTFDNETGPDFSRIFEEAPRLPDTPATRERLKDYAMHLRDLIAQKDTAALVEEFRPAIEGRYQTGTRLSRSEFMQANRQAVVVENAVLDFTRSDLRVQRWCEGRVWHIWREEATHRGLFQDSSGGGIGKIYVGEIDGELKVVRQG